MLFENASRKKIFLMPASALLTLASLGGAQSTISAQLKNQAQQLQQDIDALNKSKSDLGSHVSSSLLSSLDHELGVKESALKSVEAKIQQALTLEQDVADLNALKTKMQGRASAEFLANLDKEVAGKQAVLATLATPNPPDPTPSTKISVDPDHTPSIGSNSPTQAVLKADPPISGSQPRAQSNPEISAASVQPLGNQPATGGSWDAVNGSGARASQDAAAGKHSKQKKSAQGKNLPGTVSSNDNTKDKNDDVGKLDPSTFIHIYEDTSSDNPPPFPINNCLHCFEIYSPEKDALRKTAQLTADEKSTIVVVPVLPLPTANVTGGELELNKLYITAKIGSTDVPVMSYSEIGKDQATAKSQNGTAFQSAQNIANRIVNISNMATDILVYAYCVDPGANQTGSAKETTDSGKQIPDGCPSATNPYGELNFFDPTFLLEESVARKQEEDASQPSIPQPAPPQQTGQGSPGSAGQPNPSTPAPPNPAPKPRPAPTPKEGHPNQTSPKDPPSDADQTTPSIPTTPAAPTGLAAAAGNGQVNLTWVAGSGAESYRVARSTNVAGPYVTVATTTDPKYTDTGLTQGTAYYYVVTAVNKNGESGSSSAATATPGAATASSLASLLLRLQDRIRLHQQEIAALYSFFGDSRNLALVQLIGNDVLNIDRESLQGIVTQFQSDMNTALNSKSTDPAKIVALWDLLQRTKIVYQRFEGDRRVISSNARTYPKAKWPDACEQEQEAYAAADDVSKSALARSCALKMLVAKKTVESLNKLRAQIVPGYISLQDAGAKDGDRLDVKVEVRGETDAPGVSKTFEITVKRYGWKPQVADSFLFVHRQGLKGDTNPKDAGLDRVNFAPSPGVSFTAVYLQRGDSKGDKFVRALGPGMGLNVSFMNFNDPGFDLSTGKFTNTTGVNIQVGAGVLGSLFDNKLQFSYGWNLNADRKRQYFALGFSFISVTSSVVKYVKSK